MAAKGFKCQILVTVSYKKDVSGEDNSKFWVICYLQQVHWVPKFNTLDSNDTWWFRNKEKSTLSNLSSSTSPPTCRSLSYIKHTVIIYIEFTWHYVYLIKMWFKSVKSSYIQVCGHSISLCWGASGYGIWSEDRGVFKWNQSPPHNTQQQLLRICDSYGKLTPSRSRLVTSKS